MACSGLESGRSNMIEVFCDFLSFFGVGPLLEPRAVSCPDQELPSFLESRLANLRPGPGRHEQRRGAAENHSGE